MELVYPFRHSFSLIIFVAMIHTALAQGPINRRKQVENSTVQSFITIPDVILFFVMPDCVTAQSSSFNYLIKCTFRQHLHINTHNKQDKCHKIIS